jgi:aminoglycoside 6'-N-acetyltransferase
LDRSDFPLLVEWLAQPHVAQWWGEPLNLAGLEKEYGACIDEKDPTEVFVVLAGVRETPVGLVQFYRLSDNPQYRYAVGVETAAGVDLFIGERARCGHSMGPRLIRQAVDMIWKRYPDVTCTMAGPSMYNIRSHRAFEKAGFHFVRQVSVPDELEDEAIYVCPRPTSW